MKRKNNDKLLEIINDFKKIITEKPSLAQMFDEVRMMKFKIHPVSGDISAFNLKNPQVIEILWSLGKLDDLFQNKYNKLSSQDRHLITQVLNSLPHQLEKQLKSINLTKETLSSYTPILEMEVYKEEPIKN